MATFNVTTTNATGAGSLYQAILDANAVGGATVHEALLQVAGTSNINQAYSQVVCNLHVKHDPLFITPLDYVVDSSAIPSGASVFDIGEDDYLKVDDIELTNGNTANNVTFFRGRARSEQITENCDIHSNNNTGATASLTYGSDDSTFHAIGCTLTELRNTGFNKDMALREDGTGGTDAKITFTNCTAVNCGSIRTLRGSITINGGSFDASALLSTQIQRLIYMSDSTYNPNAHLVIMDTVIKGYSGQNGGCFRVDRCGSVVVEGSKISECTATSNWGGAMAFSSTTASILIRFNEIFDNTSNDTGGAIVIKTDGTNPPPSVIIHSNIFRDNTANTTDGAHISLDDGQAGLTFQIYNNQMTGGDCTRWGGAIRITVGASVVNFAFNTLFGNTAGSLGGGIYCGNGEINMYGNVLQGNVANSLDNDIRDNGCTSTATKNNLIQYPDNFTIPAGQGNITGPGVDALIQTLADNGGFHDTYAILDTGDAYNAGDVADLTLLGIDKDVRGAGFVRPVDAATSMGAFEIQAAEAMTAQMVFF